MKTEQQQFSHHEDNNWSTRAFESGRKAAQATDDYVHESPWVVIGSVAVSCFLLGYLLGNRE